MEGYDLVPAALAVSELDVASMSLEEFEEYSALKKRTPDLVRRQLFKTKMCPFHEEGRCQRGPDCTFAHNDIELRPLPDLRNTRLCDKVRNGQECVDPRCTFAHCRSDLRTTDMRLYKVRLCNFNKKGKCLNGEHCRFAHGTAELRGPMLPKQKPTSVLSSSACTYTCGGMGGIAASKFPSNLRLSPLGDHFDSLTPLSDFTSTSGPLPPPVALLPSSPQSSLFASSLSPSCMYPLFSSSDSSTLMQPHPSSSVMESSSVAIAPFAQQFAHSPTLSPLRCPAPPGNSTLSTSTSLSIPCVPPRPPSISALTATATHHPMYGFSYGANGENMGGGSGGVSSGVEGIGETWRSVNGEMGGGGGGMMNWNNALMPSSMSTSNHLQLLPPYSPTNITKIAGGSVMSSHPSPPPPIGGMLGCRQTIHPHNIPLHMSNNTSAGQAQPQQPPIHSSHHSQLLYLLNSDFMGHYNNLSISSSVSPSSSEVSPSAPGGFVGGGGMNEVRTTTMTSGLPNSSTSSFPMAPSTEDSQQLMRMMGLANAAFTSGAAMSQFSPRRTTIPSSSKSSVSYSSSSSSYTNDHQQPLQHQLDNFIPSSTSSRMMMTSTSMGVVNFESSFSLSSSQSVVSPHSIVLNERFANAAAAAATVSSDEIENGGIKSSSSTIAPGASMLASSYTTSFESMHRNVSLSSSSSSSRRSFATPNHLSSTSSPFRRVANYWSTSGGGAMTSVNSAASISTSDDEASSVKEGGRIGGEKIGQLQPPQLGSCDDDENAIIDPNNSLKISSVVPRFSSTSSSSSPVATRTPLPFSYPSLTTTLTARPSPPTFSIATTNTSKMSTMEMPTSSFHPPHTQAANLPPHPSLRGTEVKGRIDSSLTTEGERRKHFGRISSNGSEEYPPRLCSEKTSTTWADNANPVSGSSLSSSEVLAAAALREVGVEATGLLLSYDTSNIVVSSMTGAESSSPSYGRASSFAASSTSSHPSPPRRTPASTSFSRETCRPRPLSICCSTTSTNTTAVSGSPASTASSPTPLSSHATHSISQTVELSTAPSTPANSQLHTPTNHPSLHFTTTNAYNAEINGQYKIHLPSTSSSSSTLSSAVLPPIPSPVSTDSSASSSVGLRTAKTTSCCSTSISLAYSDTDEFIYNQETSSIQPSSSSSSSASSNEYDHFQERTVNSSSSSSVLSKQRSTSSSDVMASSSASSPPSECMHFKCGFRHPPPSDFAGHLSPSISIDNQSSLTSASTLTSLGSAASPTTFESLKEMVSGRHTVQGNSSSMKDGLVGGEAASLNSHTPISQAFAFSSFDLALDGVNAGTSKSGEESEGEGGRRIGTAEEGKAMNNELASTLDTVEE